MQAVLSRSLRPRLGRSGVSSFSTHISPVRRPTLSPLRRSLKFCDAFTLLLTPVLGAALIADTGWKDHRKQKWDKKIAQVEAETEQLRHKEIKAWNRLQIRSAQLGALHQRRLYTTAATARALQDLDDGDNHILYANEHETVQHVPETGPVNESVVPDLTEMTADHNEHALHMRQQYGRLLATQLALNMMIHLRTGRSTGYRLPSSLVVDRNVYPESLDELTKSLHKVSHALQSLQPLNTIAAAIMGEKTSAQKNELFVKVMELCKGYKGGDLSVTDFVMGFARVVTSSRVAPPLRVYSHLMSAFVGTKRENLATLAASTLCRSKLLLDNETIFFLVFHLAKLEDAKFLRMLERQLAGIGEKGVRPEQEWTQVHSGGRLVVIPSNRENDLIQILIYAHLRCGQCLEAEAYALLFREQDYGGACKDQVFRSFLAYYGTKLDWKAGSEWLQESMRWAASVAASGPFKLNRLIFRMLELCVQCGQREMYERILSAAVEADLHFVSFPYQPGEKFGARLSAIRDDWIQRTGKFLNSDSTDESAMAKAVRFQTSMAEHDGTLKDYIDAMNPNEVRAPSTSRLQQDQTQNLVVPTTVKSASVFHNEMPFENFSRWSDKLTMIERKIQIARQKLNAYIFQGERLVPHLELKQLIPPAIRLDLRLKALRRSFCFHLCVAQTTIPGLKSWTPSQPDAELSIVMAVISKDVFNHRIRKIEVMIDRSETVVNGWARQIDREPSAPIQSGSIKVGAVDEHKTSAVLNSEIPPDFPTTSTSSIAILQTPSLPHVKTRHAIFPTETFQPDISEHTLAAKPINTNSRMINSRPPKTTHSRTDDRWLVPAASRGQDDDYEGYSTSLAS